MSEIKENLLGDEDLKINAGKIRDYYASKLGASFARWSGDTGQLDFSTVSFDNRCFSISDDYGFEQIMKALRKGQVFNIEN